MRTRQRAWLLAALLGAAAAVVPAARSEAGGCRHCGGPIWQTVERTVHVPHVTWEERTVMRTVCRPEVRERTVMVTRRIPETRMVSRTVERMVPRQETREVTEMVCKPVWSTVTREVSVPVPHRETRQAVRRVCHRVPVEETRVVCRDEGYWEERPSACGCCPPCRVWVANIVREEVPVTVWKTEWVEEPYEYECVVYRHEMREQQMRVCHYEYEPVTRQVTCTVYDRHTEQVEVPVTTYRCVQEPRQVQETVYVPHQVPVTVRVPVCTTVPRTVVCRVPVGCGCYH